MGSTFLQLVLCIRFEMVELHGQSRPRAPARATLGRESDDVELSFEHTYSPNPTSLR